MKFAAAKGLVVGFDRGNNGQRQAAWSSSDFLDQ
jgi:hypothetical protein